MKKIVTKKTHFGETTAYYEDVNVDKSVLRKIVIDLDPGMRLKENDDWKLELSV